MSYWRSQQRAKQSFAPIDVTGQFMKVTRDNCVLECRGLAEIFGLRKSRKWAIFPMPRFLRRSEVEVAILRVLQLQGRAFDPAVINVMVTAFDDTLRELRVTSRHDPRVERVAQIIIWCAENGMRDAAEMRDCALKAIRGTGPVHNRRP